MSGRKSVSGGHVKALLFWEVRPQLGSHSLGRLRGTAQHQKKDVLFIIEDWNAKVGSQKISGLTGKFGLGVQNEQDISDIRSKSHFTSKRTKSV